MENNINAKLISSAKISFLFGSGVNGSLFPQLSGFARTIDKIKEVLKMEAINPNHIEDLISQISDIKIRNSVLSIFKEEIREFNERVDYNKESSSNLSNLFLIINKFIQFEENRTHRTKQVNVFTLNYDTIVDNILLKSGLFFNVLTPQNVKKKTYLYSLIGQDYLTKKYKTTFLVSKIHGTVEEPILPGLAKFDELLAEKYFEILFNMKSILRQPNSVLFIIGYSGNDKHINQMVADCFDSGLTVFWLSFDKKSSIPYDLLDFVKVIDQPDDSSQDTTKILYKELEQLWDIK